MKKKLLSLLLALAMVFTLAACGEKKPDPGKDATATEPVVILHTNDVHGAVSNYAKVAALASQYESEGAYVLILDAGDFSQGDTAVSVSEGATAVELMNMVGYDAVALGNHEFDYGFEALKKNMENAQFPVLAANVKYNGELAFVAPADECLCGTATLIEQLAQTKGIPVTRVDIPAQLKGALFLVSDEHGVVPATDADAAESDAATVAFFADGYEKLRARR